MSDEIHRPPSQLGDLRATREAELCGVFLHVMVSDGCPCRQRVPDTTKITIVNDPVAGDRHAGQLPEKQVVQVPGRVPCCANSEEKSRRDMDVLERGVICPA